MVTPMPKPDRFMGAFLARRRGSCPTRGAILLARLRRKLDPDRTRAPTETLRGRGYRLRADG